VTLATSALEIFWVMRYTNLLFTYLLTYLLALDCCNTFNAFPVYEANVIKQSSLTQNKTYYSLNTWPIVR